MLKKILLAATVALVPMTAARADVRIGLGVNVPAYAPYHHHHDYYRPGGVSFYFAPAPVYVAPAPAYYAPAPSYYQPAPPAYYYQPQYRPQPPVYVQPYPSRYGPSFPYRGY